MKNIKVLGLAIVASIIAAPAFAGETYVRNEWTNNTGYTKTDLTLDSTTTSHRNEWYHSEADKIYVDGDISLKDNFDPKHKDLRPQPPKSQTVSFNDFTVHTAGSSLGGHFYEGVVTKLGGKIFSHVDTVSNSHETSAGVR